MHAKIRGRIGRGVGLGRHARACRRSLDECPDHGYTPPPAAATGTPFDWSGMYFGVNGGYGFGTSRITTEQEVRQAILILVVG